MAAYLREQLTQPITLEYFSRRLAEGWTLSAIEWTKLASEKDLLERADASHEVPFGERIADDCKHLLEDPREMEILSIIYDGVLSGYRPGQIAANLNERGYRTRYGSVWSATAVFELMPRVIEVSPELQKRPEWPVRRTKLNLAG
jgi:hypothetical protein